jgi:uncharacterized protein YhbP (UPF0306 family)
MDEKVLRELITTLLAEHTVLTLATRHDDAPHAVSLMYASRDLTLYWVSDPDTRHSRDLEMDARASVAIARQYEDYTDIRGSQMGGIAARVDAPEEERQALDLLTAKFPFFGQLREGAAAATGPLAGAAVYRFDPEAVTYIDNSRGFGFRHTLVPGR